MTPEDLPGHVGKVLERSRALGFLGPGPVEAQIGHAVAMVELCGEERPARTLDLGSGGGLPGLVLAALRPAWPILLLDANQRRTDFLREAVAQLGWSHVDVRTLRAEAAGRASDLRGGFDLVLFAVLRSPSRDRRMRRPPPRHWRQVGGQ